jgi:hypothetical protein
MSSQTRTLGDLTVDQLLVRSDSELQYAQQILDGSEERYGTRSDGTDYDLLTAAITSARSSLIVAHGKLADTSSSASRQHYIDTRRYLPNAAGQQVDR